MTCRVVAIIQARIASSRLPGKVLLDIAGEPMLGRVIARTSRAQRVDDIVVATTMDPADDPVSAYCQERGIACTRGSQFDVLDRYYRAAQQAGADLVVRVTGDCPAIDPELIDDAIETLLPGSARDGCPAAFDFVANRLPPPFHRSYPIGLDVEVCTFAALQRAWKEGHEPVHREHVMPYLYEGVKLSASSPELEVGVSPRGFRIGLRNQVPDFGAYRWTVDTPEDLEFMRQVYSHFGGRDEFSWKQLLRLVQRQPELAAINSSVQHKTLSDVDERAARG
jgi:spore coat polysaccharide biosynthesis protein SpsF